MPRLRLRLLEVPALAVPELSDGLDKLDQREATPLDQREATALDQRESLRSGQTLET